MFNFLDSLADFIVYKILGLSPATQIAESLNFFIINIFKVNILILVIGFVIGVIREFVTPAKTKRILKGKRTGIGNIVASFLAIITPVEEFSIIPVFTGLLESGVPTSVAFTYLITAPITNEVAFALFWGLFGYKAAFAYYALGFVIGLIGGIFIGSLRVEKYIRDYLTEEKINNHNDKDKRFKDILIAAKAKSFKFFRDFWVYVFIGIAIASIIHGYVPKELLIKYVGLDNPLAIPFAVILVIFFYVNIAMTLSIIIVFVNQGLPLGTILAFTMAVTATSIPELLIMKKAVRLRLILIYMAVLLSLIIITGYLVNLIYPSFR